MERLYKILFIKYDKFPINVCSIKKHIIHNNNKNNNYLIRTVYVYNCESDKLLDGSV